MPNLTADNCGKLGSRLKKINSLGLGSLLVISASPTLANPNLNINSNVSGINRQPALPHNLFFQNHVNVSGHSRRTLFTHQAFTGSVGPANRSFPITGALPLSHMLPAGRSVEIGRLLPAQGLNLDLGSSKANIVLGANLFSGANSSITIIVDGQAKLFQVGAKVTAAEYVAIQEVLNGGTQSLVIAKNGAATGGDVDLNQISTLKVGELIIPKNVAGLDNLSINGGSLSFTGDLLNYGAIDGIAGLNSTSANTNALVIAALSIINESGGTITAPAGLTLNSTQNIVNAGHISSGGDVRLNAGSGNFVNSGLIKSSNGNIAFDAPKTSNITIDNTGGTVQAVAGNISVRDRSYIGTGNINLVGGNYLSQNLNLYSGAGAITGSVGQISGNLNSVGGAAHVIADTSTLKLGNNDIAGDPLYVNTAGDIEITGAVGVIGPSQPLTIIASGNVYAAAGDTGAALVNNGGDITVIAGAKVSYEPGGTTQATALPGGGVANASVIVDLTQASTNGGNIDLRSSTSSTVIDTSSTTAAGGNVTLVALAQGGVGGQVLLPSNSSGATISTHSSVSSGGNVTVIAGATTGTAVQIGSINAAEGPGSSAGSGTVSIANALATGNSSTNIAYSVTGATDSNYSSSTKIVAAPLTYPSNLAGNITLGTVTGGDINIQAAGGNLNLQNSTYSSGFNTSGSTGSIALTFNNLTYGNSGSAPLTLNASGSGSQNGGKVTVVDTGGALTLGSSAGQMQLIANSGASGTSAGTISATAATNLTINDAGGIQLAGPTGSAANTHGTLNLVANQIISLLPTTSYLTAGNINLVNGLGNLGGSAAPFQISATNLTVNAAGNVYVNNLGAITLLTSTTPGIFSVSTTPDANGNGSIKIADLAAIAAATINLSSSETTGGVGGIAPATSGNTQTSLFAEHTNLLDNAGSGSTAVVGGGSGNITVSTSNPAGGSNITVDTAGNITITDSSPSLTATVGGFQHSSATSDINISAIHNLTLTSLPATFASLSLAADSSLDGGIITLPANVIQSTTSATNPNGGNISLSASAIAWNGMATQPLVLNASASSSGTGNGGIINLVISEGNNLSIGITAGNYDLISTGGAAGGSGGSVVVSCDGNIALATAAGSGALAPTGLNVAASTGGVGGNGGTIDLSAGSLSWSSQATNALLLSVNATGNNSGGSVSITSSNQQNFGIGNLAGDLVLTANSAATAGNGGSILLSTAGNVRFDSASSLTASSGTKTGNGGSITIDTGGLSNNSGANLVLNASAGAAANGSGGSISLFSVNDLSLGNSAGSFSLLAQGGKAGGAGGSITVSTYGNTVFGASAFSVSPLATNANGGAISISAASYSLNSSLAQLSLTANGKGTGDGGSLSLQLSSPSASLDFGTAAGDISLSASGANGGSIFVNVSGNVSLDTTISKAGQAIPSGLLFTPTGKNGNGGTLSITAGQVSYQNAATVPLLLSADGLGTGNGGSISLITNAAINIGNSPGNFSLSAKGVNGGAIAIQGTSVSIADTVTMPSLIATPVGLSVAASGANGNGGTISLNVGSLTWTDFNSSYLNLDVSGRGTGNGGTINLVLGSPVTLGTLSTQVSLSAQSGSTGGSAGSIAITSSGSIGLTGNGLNIAALGPNSNGGDVYISGSPIINLTAAPIAINVSGTGTGAGGDDRFRFDRWLDY